VATSAQYQRAARRAARQYNLPFFVRQIRQESGFRDVRSPMGAQGPAQLMPATARSLGVNPHGKRSIWAAARLMRGYVDKYGVEGALRAYNAGPGAIQASHGYAETHVTGRRRHSRRAWSPWDAGHARDSRSGCQRRSEPATGL
jgi:soluble lytic murein transglycosylase-like protein